MKIIGITGGTGAGKTTALRVLEEMGAVVIDCDALYHQLLRENRQMLAEIEARFPGVVLDGELQRKKLGAIVFGDDKAIADLNAITHPYVDEASQAILEQARQDGKKLAAVDAIALIESGFHKDCDVVVAVLAPKEQRARRIMARDNIGLEYALQRIEAQQSDDFYRQHCTLILYNDFADEAAFADYCRKSFGEMEE